MTGSAGQASLVLLTYRGCFCNIILQSFALCMVITGQLLGGVHSEYQCNCYGVSDCADNAYCESGCEPGHYGPGCQFRNIAYGASALQSSTEAGPTNDSMPASFAVDGQYVEDLEDDWASTCSRTNGSDKNPWWQVIINEGYLYVIDNVTIVNLIGAEEHWLRNFSVYLSNGTQKYPDGNWTLCFHEPQEAVFMKSYGCNQTNIAKSVAITQRNVLSPYLTLCEVVIGGYDYLECSEGSTGPGCLLISCDSQECVNGSSCGPMRSCRFQRCPGNEHLPPDCWITLPNFAAYVWSTQFNGSTITLTGVPTAETNFWATGLDVNVSTEGSKIDNSSRVHYELGSNGSVSLFFESERGVIYYIKMIPIHCFSDEVCPDENGCFEAPVCVEGASSDWIEVETGGGYSGGVIAGEEGTTRGLDAGGGTVSGDAAGGDGADSTPRLSSFTNLTTATGGLDENQAKHVIRGDLQLALLFAASAAAFF